MCCKRAIDITSKPLGGREMSRSSDIVSQLQRRRAERKKPKVNSVLMKVSIDDSQLDEIVTAGDNKPPPITLQKTGGRNSLSLFFSIGLHVSLALLLGFIYIKDRISSEDDGIGATLVTPDLTLRERTNLPARKAPIFEAEQQEIEVPLDTTVVTDTNILNPRDGGFTLPSGHGTDLNLETPGLNEGPRVVINPGRIKNPVAPTTTTFTPPKLERPDQGPSVDLDLGPEASGVGLKDIDIDITKAGNEPPKITKKIKPTYPKTAKRAEKEGTVKLQATIGTDGIPKNIVALTKLGFGLEDAAINALKKWRFIAGKKNGKDAEMTVILPIEFKLEE